jgi:hypothetical protein
MPSIISVKEEPPELPTTTADGQNNGENAKEKPKAKCCQFQRLAGQYFCDHGRVIAKWPLPFIVIPIIIVNSNNK